MDIYYLNQKIDITNGKYLVSDVNKQPILQVVESSLTGTLDRMFGNIFSIGHTLHINNLEGEEQVTLKKKVGFIWSYYDVVINNNISASIQQNKDWFKPRFSIDSQYGTYTISGDIFAKHFTLIKDECAVAKVNKKSLSFTDSYEICVYEPDKYKLIIAIVLAIDNSVHN